MSKPLNSPPQRSGAPAPAPPPFAAYAGSEPYIFISYSHQDREPVYSELRHLNEIGYRIWYDEGIKPSKEFAKEIAASITNAACCVAFFTPQAVSSNWVRNEVRYALMKHKPVLVIYLEKTELADGLDLELISIQAVSRHELTDDRYRAKLHSAIPSDARGAPPPRPGGSSGIDSEFAVSHALAKKLAKKREWQAVAAILREALDELGSHPHPQRADAAKLLAAANVELDKDTFKGPLDDDSDSAADSGLLLSIDDSDLESFSPSKIKLEEDFGIDLGSTRSSKKRPSSGSQVIALDDDAFDDDDAQVELPQTKVAGRRERALDWDRLIGIIVIIFAILGGFAFVMYQYKLATGK